MTRLEILKLDEGGLGSNRGKTIYDEPMIERYLHVLPLDLGFDALRCRPDVLGLR